MSSTSRSSVAGLLILLAAVLLICVIIISDFFFRNARIDLTENNQYTLSQGTVNVLKSLEEPVTLRFFFSERLANDYPQIRVYGRRIRDLLRAYASRSGGNVLLQVVDPEPFSEDEDQAVALGIRGVPTETGENLYFGLVGTNTIDGREVVPFFSQEREPYLEYDLTELIYRLTLADKPKLGLLSTLPLEFGPGGAMAAMQGGGQPFVLYEQLQGVFDIQSIANDADVIDADVDVLMLVHPAGLPQKTLYAIDQFVLGGGRALVFVDPLAELAQSQQAPPGQPMMGAPQSSTLGPLFDAWGVDYDETKVLGDLGRALRVQAGPTASRPIVDYVVWLGLRAEDMDAEDLVSADVGLLQLASTGVLAAKEDATTTFSPLIRSTENSMLYDAEEVSLTFDPDELLADFTADPNRYAIAARISGDVKSAFPDGAPAADVTGDDLDLGDLDPGNADSADTDAASEDSPAEHLAQSESPINVLVFADTDLFDDKFWVQQQNFLGQRIVVPTADNGSLVVNAVDNLMGSNDLISLRSRGRDSRPLVAVEQLRREADARLVSEQQALEAELQETERRLAELQSAAGGESEEGILSGDVLSPEVEAEIEKFRGQLLDTRRRLRDVQGELRGDIERLENWVKFANIGLVPILIAIAAIGLAVIKRQRRAQARRGSA